MSSLAYSPNPQLSSGMGGAGMVNAPTSDDPNLQIAGLPSYGVPQNYGLPTEFAGFQAMNPLGAFTDDQYLADDASLRADIGQQYATILKQLGYMDPHSGNVIPGTVAQDANIQLAGYMQDLYNEQLANVQSMQQGGTLFSGIRPQLLAQAQTPTQQNIGQLTLNTSRSLNDLYNQAQNLVTHYNVQNQGNLAAAAGRNLAAIQKQQLLNKPPPAPGGSDIGPTTGDPNAPGPGDYPASVPTTTGTVAPASKPIVMSGQPVHVGQPVTVPVGYGGGGWTYPVGKTGQIRKY